MVGRSVCRQTGGISASDRERERERATVPVAQDEKGMVDEQRKGG